MAEYEDDGAPRAFWSGTITFGLVSIPVELFPANRSQRVSLRMVSEDGVPLARRYFCPAEDRELEWGEIVRGYEVEKDAFVVVSDDELEKIAPEKTRDIDLRTFVGVDEIDPIHFERAYYLTPGGNSTKAYRLLAATMERTGRAGIATFVMRGKEYLVAILAEKGILRAETLRFANEVRTPEDVGLPAPDKASATLVKKFEKAINAITEKQFDDTELVDRGAERLLKLVEKKRDSGEGVVAAPAGTVSESAGEGVIDLMEVLKRSLQGASAAKGADAGKDAATAKGAAPRKDAAAAKGAAAGKDAASGSGRKKYSRSRSAKESSPGSSTPSAKDTPSKDALTKRTRDELYEMAKDLEIEGRSGMTKSQLIAAIAGD